MSRFRYIAVSCCMAWGSLLLAQGNALNVSDLDIIESDMDFGFADDFATDEFDEGFEENFFLDGSLEQPANEMFFNQFEEPNNSFFNPIDMTNNFMTDSSFRTIDQDIGPIVQMIESPNLFAGAPPIPGSLRIMARGEAPEEYRVRMGDTLFDICDQLLDEPGYWPKLWALNPYIRNPHFIYPGMVLRFYPGDEETPPFLQVVLEDDVLPIDRGQLSEDELLRQDMSGLLTRSELPDRTPVIGADEVQAFPEMDEAFVTHGSIFQPTEIRVMIPAFFFERRVDSLGEVVGGTSGSMLIDRDQTVVIRSRGEISSSTGYSVVRYSGQVDHPKSGRFVAYRYEFIGQVEIINQIEGQLFSAKVLLNRLGLQPGDLLIPYQTVRREVPLRAAGKNGNGQAVIGFEQPFLKMGGRGSFVMLETSSDPVTSGETLNIYQNVQRTATSFSASSLPEFRKRIATAHIIETFGPAAVAYILEDRREVRIGDDTGD